MKFGENAIALPTKTAAGKGRVYIARWCVRWLTAAPAPTLHWARYSRSKLGERAIALPTKTGAGKRLVGAGARSAIGKTSPLPAPALLL
ncbi:hypothetical protein [Arthrospira platensis]|uniref:hypothetical protein n=1 Tax=Limnospira TaxID=2596745 RepID=UPI00049F92B4|nr:hypothetical protein [Arthrospira platensis]KDR54222.1 hypothetical protein APPUASWS_029540 [Arthrospira platensis str. Paraca]MBD2671351.1 hypothetical protein [Arthrospira platensis FACHB-439]MDF2212140.1 hypothetical protein [Arthrospira platensis NCB002]MDT9185594.1 hypothetical protein [Limnospira sp. PMC 289.06]QQW27786.1 hypothetical protein AP9108_21815 [Arthrospira sp. PCC 9108]